AVQLGSWEDLHYCVLECLNLCFPFNCFIQLQSSFLTPLSAITVTAPLTQTPSDLGFILGILSVEGKMEV
ncbi:MAG: hypothetical protein JAY74_19800, partial [Candidatus Thiodiazotropha taylori]|nr:hypothetical protein [Candidatus Thiodiazotropha taylori]